ncbi:MAG: DHH family phosphoesterase [Oscillospiraceae bacterium]|jgi:phosphoesterase RecJ-like protein|nr:DHH family phosphoesterase [Oscillospiraceae bacterium]
MKRAIERLLRADKLLILTHTLPDGDTVGSAAALCEGLRSLGKTAYVAENAEITPRYLPYISKFAPPDGYEPSCVAAVDTATRERLQKAYRAAHVDISIDHHTPGPDFADIHYTDEAAAATAEIVYELLTELGASISRETATALYLGISTDTGCFRYSNTTARSHYITAALLDTGIDVSPLNDAMFEKRSLARLAIEARMCGGLRFLLGGKAAIGVITREDIAACNAGEDDMESIAALTRRVEGVEIGVLLRETADGVKISVRTSADYRADRLCALFGGGGHHCAAGATMRGASVADAETAVTDALLAL